MCNPNTSPTGNPIPGINIPVAEKSRHQDDDDDEVSKIYFDVLSLRAVVPEKESIKKNEDDEVDNSVSMSSSSFRLVSISIPEVVRETQELFSLAFPILLTNIILYSRSMLSMVFLGRIGDVELAAGSLAIAFANITGYSVMSGLALGMEPLCSQAFGARRPKLMSLTLQRCVIFLLCCSIPISLFWSQMTNILRLLHQNQEIASLARTYILYSLPDLLTYSFIHPIKIYLRAQGITRPVTLASLAGALLHLPITLLLVERFRLGILGVAMATSTSNLASLVFLMAQVWLGGLHTPTWSPPSWECLTGWGQLVKLAAPSCVSVCLEWWWYEIMIVLCGLLVHPSATVASMGVLIQTTGLIYNFPSSLSNAVSARVGNELGAGRPERARLSAFLSITWAGMMGLAAMVFAWQARHVWARMFTGEAEILALTAAALPILGLCELGNCPQTVACGVVRGTARPTTAANVNLGAFYVVGTPVAIGLAFYYGVGFSGLWFGLLSAQICCAGLMLYVVGTTDWECQAKRAQMLTHSGGTGHPSEATGAVDAPLLLPGYDDDDDEQNNHSTEDQKEPLICILVTSS